MEGQLKNIRGEIHSMKNKLELLTNEKANFNNTLDQTKRNLNFMLDSKKYRLAQQEAATTDVQKDNSTLQISNQSTMAIITHYLELIRDYILRMKHFTNIGIEDSIHKGKYLESEPDNTVESGSSSSSFSEDSP